MKPVKKISVIVSAYNRDTFLMEALKSVANQTLQSDYFEVLVIKNFKSPEIDEFCEKNNFQPILFEKESNVPEMYWNAIEYSKNEIITFLDDDDTYSAERLEVIFKVFNDNMELSFYHNCAKIFYEEDKEMVKQILNAKHIPVQSIVMQGPNYGSEVIYYDAAFNMSSIAILKNVIRMRELRLLLTNPDMFMLFSAMRTSNPIMIDNRFLTNYRVHSKNTSVNLSRTNTNEFRKKYAKTFYQISEIINGLPNLLKLLNIYMVHSLIEFHIMNAERAKIYLEDFPKLIQKSAYILKWEPEKLADLFMTYVSVFIRSIFPNLLKYQILHK